MLTSEWLQHLWRHRIRDRPLTSSQPPQTLMSTPSLFRGPSPCQRAPRRGTAQDSRAKLQQALYGLATNHPQRMTVESHAMQSESLIKCAHPPCRCIVEVEDQFCSTACASKPPLNVPCPCGHPECVASKETLEGTKRSEFDRTSRDPQAGR